MTAVISPATPTSMQVDPGRPRTRRSWWKPVALFIVLSAAYFVAGSVLIMRYNLYDGDGTSRVANAGNTLTWAITGWIVNGELFATLSSRYGNGSQVAEAVARSGTAHSASADVLLIAVRLFAMQPFVGMAVILAAALAALTKKLDAMVPVAVFGAVLAFSASTQFTGTTFGWFRCYLLAIPMVVVIALVCWTPTSLPVGWWRLDTLPSRLGAALLVASLLLGIPVTARSMLNQDIGNQQLQFGLNSLLNPGTYPPDEQWYRRMGDDDRLLASYLDRKHLTEGSVLMDTFFCWGSGWPKITPNSS